MRDASMHCQVKSVDSSRNGQHIKCLLVLFVDSLVIESEHLLPEVERFVHVTRLMVTSEKVNIIWILQLKTKEVSGNFRPVVTSIDVVSEKQKLLVGHFITTFKLSKHGNQVIELPMNITDDDYFAIDAYKIWLCPENNFYTAHDFKKTLF